MTIRQHHLYMASREPPTGRPEGGKVVKVERPHRTAVADFRFTSPYEPQLRLQSTFFTRTDPVQEERKSVKLKVTNTLPTSMGPDHGFGRTAGEASGYLSRPRCRRVPDWTARRRLIG